MAGSEKPPKADSAADEAVAESPSSVDTISAAASPFQPLFNSSLDFTLVRDFAYKHTDILHYGVVPGDDSSDDEEENTNGTGIPWEELQKRFGKSSKTTEHRIDLVPMTLRDGPPYAIDPDLQSPIVTSIRRKKYFSNGAFDERSLAERAHGDTRNTGHDEPNLLSPKPNDARRDSHFAGSRVLHQSPEATDQELYYGSSDANDDEDDYDGNDDDSEYSRDYQFSITSPDEEMHGKAVALFDFARENENELPLVEGQVIWVSYRHGQGWLVAEDPKTRESGLVPEAYVRLLREIQGGWNSLNNLPGGSGNASPLDPTSPHAIELDKHGRNPKQARVSQLLSGSHQSPPQQSQPLPHRQQAPTSHPQDSKGGAQPGSMSRSASQRSNGTPKNRKSSASTTGIASTPSNTSSPHAPPVLSHFSTSSKDLDLYPSHLLAGKKEGQTLPPKVDHYHGQGGSGLGPGEPVALTATPESSESKETRKEEAR